MFLRISLLATLLMVGCGSSNLPKLARVYGVVTVNGQPLSNAIVTFTPKDQGRPSVAETDDQGRYELLYNVDNEGAVIGKHVVRLQLVEPSDSDDGKRDGRRGAATGLPPAATNGSIIQDVKGGKNEIDIAV